MSFLHIEMIRKAHREGRPEIVPSMLKLPSGNVVGLYVYHPSGREKALELGKRFLEHVKDSMRREGYMMYGKSPYEQWESLYLYHQEKEIEGIPVVFVGIREEASDSTGSGILFLSRLFRYARSFKRREGI